eukprot:3720407-Pleurochrysis_carterae.AAC.5
MSIASRSSDARHCHTLIITKAADVTLQPDAEQGTRSNLLVLYCINMAATDAHAIIDVSRSIPACFACTEFPRERRAYPITNCTHHMSPPRGAAALLTRLKRRR